MYFLSNIVVFLLTVNLYLVLENAINGLTGYQILDTHKTVSKDLPLDKESTGNLPQLPEIIKNNDVLTVSKFHAEHKSKKAVKEKRGLSKGVGGKEISFNTEGSAAVNESIADNKNSSTIRSSVLTRNLTPSSTYVFALVQFHQEKIKLRPKHLPTSPKMAKMYIQFCGLMHSSEDAQNAANTQMLNMKITHQKFEHRKLQWRPYVDFMSMPLLHSDHFVVYCRSAPVAVASYSPNINMLEVEYPEACKPNAQRFTCALFRSVDRSDLVLSDASDDLALVKELQSFVEIQSVYGSPVDCIRNAKTHVVNDVKQRADSANITPCVFPLFHWLLLSDETFEKFDCRRFTEDGQREATRAATAARMSIGDMYQFTKANSHLVFSSKERPAEFDRSAIETFTKAGVNENAHKIAFKRDASESLITPTLTLRMLDEEVYRKELASEILRKRQAAAMEFATPSNHSGMGVNYNAPGSAPSRNRVRLGTSSGDGFGSSSSVQSTVDTTTRMGVDDEFDDRKKVPTETTEQRLASIYNMIQARQRVIDQNDNLCVLEKFVKNKSKQLKDKKERLKKMGTSQSLPNLLSSPRRPTSTPQAGGNSSGQNGSDNQKQEAAGVLDDEEIDYGIDIPKSIKYAVQKASQSKSDPYIMQRAMSMQQYDMNLNLQTIVADVKAAKKSYVKGVFQETKERKKRGSVSSSVSSSSDAYSEFDFGAYSNGSKPSTANGDKRSHASNKETKVPLSTKLEVLEELLQNSVKGDL